MAKADRNHHVPIFFSAYAIFHNKGVEGSYSFKVPKGAEFLVDTTYVLFSGGRGKIDCDRLSAVQRVSGEIGKVRNYPCSNENEARVLEVMLAEFERRWSQSIEGDPALKSALMGHGDVKRCAVRNRNQLFYLNPSENHIYLPRMGVRSNFRAPGIKTVTQYFGPLKPIFGN